MTTATYGTNGIISSDGKSITLGSGVKLTEIEAGTTPSYTGVTNIDASATTVNMSLTAAATGSKLVGNAKVNLLTGGADADTLDGQAGNDTLAGGSGKDSLKGGAGADVFIYSAGEDTIADYGDGSDKISLEGFTMANVTSVAVAGDDDTTVGTDGFITLGFKDSNSTEGTLKVHVTNTLTSAVTIMDGGDSLTSAGSKGKAYKFVDGGYAVGNSVTLVSASDTVTMDTDAYKTYSSLTADVSNATVKGKATATTITLNNGGSVAGGAGADKLIANDGGTLTGNTGADLFVFGGGNVTVTDYSTVSGNSDKVSLGAGWTITDVESVTNGEEGFKLKLKNTLEETETTGTLTLDKITSATKVNLTTTKASVKGAKETTSTANVYFFDHVIANSVLAGANGEIGYTNATAVTVMSDASGDFSTILVKSGSEETTTGGAAGNVAKFAVASITSAGVDDVTGNSKPNYITLENTGGTFAGGLGADTYFIKGGNVTITDFGIGAASVGGSGDEATIVQLATAVTTTATQNAAGETTRRAYDATSVTSYAPGKDIVKVYGKVTDITVDGITKASVTVAAADLTKETPMADNTFSVTLSVDMDGDIENTTDDTYEVVLSDIMRGQKSVKAGTGTDTVAVVVNANADLTDLKALIANVYQSTNLGVDDGKYTKLAWNNIESLISGDGFNESPALDDLDNGSIDPVASSSGRTADNNSGITPSGDAAFSGSDNNSSNNHSGLNH